MFKPGSDFWKEDDLQQESVKEDLLMENIKLFKAKGDKPLKKQEIKSRNTRAGYTISG